MTRSLDITRRDIRVVIGRYLGYGRNPDVWTEDQITWVDDIIDSGLRQFYYPSPLPGESCSHTWSFMNQLFEVGVVPGSWEYELPREFGGHVVGSLIYSGPGMFGQTIPVMDADEVWRRRSQISQSTGIPTIAAFTCRISLQHEPQRWMLLLWPSPSSAGKIQGRFVVNPLAVDDDTAYPLGGAPHAETLVQSCLAAAESRVHNVAGLNRELFMERLRTSVALDRSLTGAKYLGDYRDGMEIEIPRRSGGIKYIQASSP